MGFLNARTLATIIGLLLATPVLTAPSGDGTVEGFYPVENIVPQEYIDQVRAYHEVKARTEWQRNKRALNTLQKRVPDDALCDRGDEWVARNCLSDEGPQLWEDECQTPEGDLYERDGQCPPDTVCMPDEIVRIINGEEVEESDIICQPSTPPRTDIVTTKNKQYGYRPIGIYGGTQIVEIPILADYSSASVSAELLSKSFPTITEVSLLTSTKVQIGASLSNPSER